MSKLSKYRKKIKAKHGEEIFDLDEKDYRVLKKLYITGGDEDDDLFYFIKMKRIVMENNSVRRVNLGHETNFENHRDFLKKKNKANRKKN